MGRASAAQLAFHSAVELKDHFDRRGKSIRQTAKLFAPDAFVPSTAPDSDCEGRGDHSQMNAVIGSLLMRLSRLAIILSVAGCATQGSGVAPPPTGSLTPYEEYCRKALAQNVGESQRLGALNNMLTWSSPAMALGGASATYETRMRSTYDIAYINQICSPQALANKRAQEEQALASLPPGTLESVKQQLRQAYEAAPPDLRMNPTPQAPLFGQGLLSGQTNPFTR